MSAGFIYFIQHEWSLYLSELKVDVKNVLVLKLYKDIYAPFMFSTLHTHLIFSLLFFLTFDPTGYYTCYVTLIIKMDTEHMHI